MQRFYSKLVRKSYRTLRHPKIRKVNWLNRIVLKLFKRDLWTPTRRRIAIGLSLGLFCSMLPIPMQMIIAGIICLFVRGNIPIALAACWISNPLTQLPLMFCQEQIGKSIRDVSTLDLLEPINMQGTIPLIDHTVNLANFAVGVAVTSIGLAIIAVPLVYLFYMIVPNKYTERPTHITKSSNDDDKPIA